MIRDRVVTRCYGALEVKRKTKITFEITMSEDWAECVASQAEDALEDAGKYRSWLIRDKGEEPAGPSQELRDLISAIDEAMR